MAFVNKGKVRILRGNLNGLDPNDVVGNTPLWDGQPFYDKTSGKLYVGTGDGTKIKDTNPINAGHSDTADTSDYATLSGDSKNTYYFVQWEQHGTETDGNIPIVDLVIDMNPNNLSYWVGIIRDMDPTGHNPIKIKKNTSKVIFKYTEDGLSKTKTYEINYDWWAETGAIRDLYEETLYTFYFSDLQDNVLKVGIDPIVVNTTQSIRGYYQNDGVRHISTFNIVENNDTKHTITMYW